MQTFPVARKKKSADLCSAFASGAKGAAKDAAVFYGIDDSNQAAFDAIKKSGRDWFYIDNSYFDCSRGTHFRVTKNALQHSGQGATNGSRFRALGQKVRPWRQFGRHVVLCPQSDDFMRRMIGYKGSWTQDMILRLRKHTQRPLRVREWNRDKMSAAATLADDLRDAWCLVTHSSAAAISALLHGVPVVSESGAAASMSGTIQGIDMPFTPEGRERFFGVLADNQWTQMEMAKGIAWQGLSDQ